YKPIEKATAATPGKVFSRTPKELHAIALSVHIIYEGDKICRSNEVFQSAHLPQGVISFTKIS
ncbi:MAG: hypothetical protein E6161_03290, partial [Dialister sp.]|nr:hypothetical protein [Dialister sp.]